MHLFEELTPDEIKEVQDIIDGRKELDWSSNLYTRLYNFYSGEMPYMIAKSGDTVSWITERLRKTPMHDGGKTNPAIEKFISRYNLTGKDVRLKFKNDPKRYFSINIHPDRKHIFVFEEKNGSRITKNKKIEDIISINEKPVIREVKKHGGEIGPGYKFIKGGTEYTVIGTGDKPGQWHVSYQGKNGRRSTYMFGGEIKKDGGTLGLHGGLHLPYEISVYVPSTKEVDKHISKKEMDERTTEVTKFLSDKFGGFTSMQTTGGYVDHTGNLVKEPIVKITSFSTEKSFSDNKSNLISQIKEWNKQWGQEAIGLEFEGDLYYVSSDTRADGGYAGLKKASMKDYFITGPKASLYKGKIWFSDTGVDAAEKLLSKGRFDEFMKKYYLDLDKNEAKKFVELKMKSQVMQN